MQQIELTPKRLELLTQTVPELARVVVLWDRFSADQFEAAREAARILKIPLEGIGGNTRHKQPFVPLKLEVGLARPLVERDSRRAVVP